MLPLLGRSKKIIGELEIGKKALNDDWCIPDDDELKGILKFEPIEKVKGEIDAKPSIIAEDYNSVVCKSDTFDQTIFVESYERGCEIESENDEEYSESQVEFEEYFSEDESFYEPEIVSTSPVSYKTTDFHHNNNITKEEFDRLLLKLEALELEIAKVNSKVSKLEDESKKEKLCDSDASIFVDEFVGVMQGALKTGLKYQQEIVSKIIDELDSFFEIK